jgi:DNA-binding MarR family transcriptional regulator
MSQSLSKVRDEHLGRMLLKLERHFTRQVLSKLAADGIEDITLRHFVVIPHIDHQGVRAIDIARQVGISKQAVSKLVDELVQKGYLELKPDPSDGRASLVFMSPKGNEFLKKAIKHTQQVEKKWANEVGQQEFKSLKSAMVTLLKSPMLND